MHIVPWFTKSFSMSWQTPAIGSSSLLPSQLSFLSLVTQEQSRNRTFPLLKSSPLRNPTQGCSCNQQPGWTIPPLFCFSPNVHESARFSFANWSPFFQNWFSSGRGSGYVSWILERDMSNLCLVKSTLRLTSHLSIPGLWSLISRNAANPLNHCLKVTAENLNSHNKG